MTQDEFNKLSEGDIVQGKSSGLGYTIIKNSDGRLVGIRLIDISNPDEWILIKKNPQNEKEAQGDHIHRFHAEDIESIICIDCGLRVPKDDLRIFFRP